ncbi:MAG: D-alanine--D-alanine ligase family protein [Minisyncoccia bacterium]
MNKRKLNIGVVFGGRSFEHEVSLVSARAIIQGLNKKKYQITPIGINKDGKWLFGQLAKNLLNGQPIKQGGGVSIISEKIIKKIDIFFPVLHGVYGEDGTIQGLFEMFNKPYVGAGVLGSALGMDKVMQKMIFLVNKLPTVEFIWFLFSDFQKNPSKIIASVKKTIGFPCFVKPSNSGSSVGISKVKNIAQLSRAIKLAAKYDIKILIEKAVPNVREIEISVLGNECPKVSLPGEIKSSNEFYDYNAKYVDGKSVAIIPAKLNKKMVKQIQRLAIRAYRALDCAGMARVDFLLDNKIKKFYLNEINTIPGFTSISMYPKLWQISGIEFPKLLEFLIKFAIKRYNQKQKLSTSYQLSNKWYKT